MHLLCRMPSVDIDNVDRIVSTQHRSMNRADVNMVSIDTDKSEPDSDSHERASLCKREDLRTLFFATNRSANCTVTTGHLLFHTQTPSRSLRSARRRHGIVKPIEVDRYSFLRVWEKDIHIRLMHLLSSILKLFAIPSTDIFWDHPKNRE